MRLADFTFAFPALLSAIIMTALSGRAGQLDPRHRHLQRAGFARMTRAQRAVVARATSSLAARALGKGEWRISSSTCCPTSPRS